MINPLEKLFGRFIPYRGARTAEVDPEIFSHLQLHIAAHPDIETSCVLANLFRAIYMGSTLFYVESLEHLDATSRSLARDLVRAKLSNAFLPEEWDEAHRLISQLPAERGGIAPREFGAAAVTSAFAEKSATVSPAVGSLAWMRAWVEYFKWVVPRRAATAFAFASLRGGFDGFKYLWGAPAAAAVIGAFFGVVLLDEQLELRRMIISYPPVQWIAEIAGLELGGDEEPAVDDVGPPVPAKARSSSLARSQPEAQPVGVEQPAAIITHAKEVASGQEVALEGFVKPPAAVPEHLETSHALEKPKTAPISRERPDQQFAPRPIPVLDRTTGGDSGGGGAQSVPEATSGKFPAEKVQNPDANSIPKIADDKPGSPKTNSVATPAKPIQQELKKVRPAVINAKRDENRTQKPSANESPAERAETSVQVIGIKEHGTIAGIVDRIERTPERPENNASDTKGLERRNKSANEIERAGTAELEPPAGVSGRAERAAKVERALVKAVERIERVEPVERSEVRRPERGVRVERAEVSRPDRLERTERFDRPNLERPERERVERPERAERVDRAERVERVERAEKVERPEKLERIERKLVEKAERILRAERR